MGRGWAIVLCLFTATAAADPATGPTPSPIAIIIDDLGDSLTEGMRAVGLPGPIACAILPHTAHGARLARAAHAAGKEVLLHLPMESLLDEEPGPGALETSMPGLELALMLRYDLSTVPHAVGVNNHMGSRLTSDRVAMERFMQALRAAGPLFFVDSMTSAESVAVGVAREHGIPALRRSVFLDNDRAPDAIAAQLTALESRARRDGYALAIGHPYPETLAALERWLPHLAERRLELVPLSLLLAQQSGESPWPPSSFH